MAINRQCSDPNPHRQYRKTGRDLEHLEHGRHAEHQWSDHQPEGRIPPMAGSSEKRRRRSRFERSERFLFAPEHTPRDSLDYDLADKCRPVRQPASADRSEHRAFGARPAKFSASQPPRSPPRRAFQRSARAFQWTAEDRNGDKLVYDVYYKEINDASYKLLRENIEETFFTIDGQSLPTAATPSGSSPKIRPQTLQVSI